MLAIGAEGKPLDTKYEGCGQPPVKVREKRAAA
jgi:hypothetical protein